MMSRRSNLETIRGRVARTFGCFGIWSPVRPGRAVYHTEAMRGERERMEKATQRPACPVVRQLRCKTGG